MELYTIEKGTNRRESFIDHYQSFIWTERYSAYGDFEILAEYNQENIQRLTPGTFIGFDESDRIMVVRQTLKTEDEDGVKTFKISGLSLESIFLDRAARQVFSNESWKYTGTPADTMRYIVNRICIIGDLDVSDIIPNLTSTDTVLSGNSRQRVIKKGSIYDRLVELSSNTSLGFKITYNVDNPALNFIVYQGVNKTDVNGVTFSQDNDSLLNTTELNSIDNYKNTVVAYSLTTGVIFNIDGITRTGFDRRILLVDGTDIVGTSINDSKSLLRERAEEELANYKRQILVDGQINPDSIFKYKVDYNLGDRVNVRLDSGASNVSRVTEHIWSYGDNGLSNYPTLETEV